jgi:hypothetical protein
MRQPATLAQLMSTWFARWRKLMPCVSSDVRGAVAGFLVLLSKGLMDDSRWDWDVERFDRKHYQAAFCDPSILRTTLAVFLNTLKLDDHGNVVNYHDARFRAFQYFRALIDPAYPLVRVTPPFQPFEIEEQDWLTWEN